MTDADLYRVPSWHAQHPASTEKRPLCGTLSARGGPTWRVATITKVTCKKCLRALAKNATLKDR